MIRKCSLFLLALCWALGVRAQLDDGSIAPNFTATDINGNTYTLYDILDEGKTVVIDVSATWCPPCWSYHESHALADVWNEYGPDGTDEMFVFFIEGDANTGMDDLLGQTSNSMGNWIEDTPYPIIDDASLASLYGINYYPTIYSICPDRRIIETRQISTEAHYENVGGCLQALSGLNARIWPAELLAPFCGYDLLTPTVIVQNMGASALTDFRLEFYKDGELDQFKEWSGDLSTYGLTWFTFSATPLHASDEAYFLLTEVNGGEDDLLEDNILWVSSPQTEDMSFTVEVLTDGNGSETYWELRDEDGAVYGSGGNPNATEGEGSGASGGYDDNTTYTDVVTVPAHGCYEFYIRDDYGDGICCSSGDGYFRVTDEDGAVLAEGGDFDDLDVGIFQSVEGVVSTLDLVAEDVRVYPNPADELINLDFYLNEGALIGLEVYNTLGQVVYTMGASSYGAGQHTVRIDVSGFSDGVYMATLRGQYNRTSFTFAVGK